MADSNDSICEGVKSGTVSTEERKTMTNIFDKPPEISKEIPS